MMPKDIHYFTKSAEGKVKITYTLNKLEQEDMDEVEKEMLSFLRKTNLKSRKFKNITLARYTSEDFVMGSSVTPNIAPVDVICIDYDNNWLAKDVRRELREELLKNSKITRLSERELVRRIRDLHEYDIEFLYYDKIGIAKGAGELAFLIKDNSFTIFYYRYSWLKPVESLVEQINTSIK